MSPSIKPVYTTPRANSTISLRRLPVEIICGGAGFQCLGKAELILQPDIRFVIAVELSESSATAMFHSEMAGQISLRCEGQVKPVKAQVLSLKYSFSKSNRTNAQVVLFPNPQLLTLCSDRRKRLRSVVFHVMNFPAFFSTHGDDTDIIHQKRAGGFKRLGRAAFSSTEWRIELQALPNTQSLVEELRVTGGYAITHVGRLIHPEGRSFTVSSTEKALRDLHRFLSFSRGLWTPVILPVGYDANGARTFEEWAVPLSTGWEPRSSWFDEMHGESLGELYPGFTALLNDPQMGKSVSDALYWYLRSNRAGEGAGVDSGIILSQAALERISVAYLMKVGISPPATATHILRKMCQILQLPTSIPRALPRIYNARRRGIWRDALEAITKVRNELVHPNTRLEVALNKVVSSTWVLAQWYVEVLILRLANYRGVYSDRRRARWRGEVYKLPRARR